MTDADSSGTDLISLVGATIRHLRTAQKVSVTDLANRADVSRRMLTAIEGGTANASLVTLDKIARALGVEFSALVRSPSESFVEVLVDAEATTVWRSGQEGSRGRVFTTTKSRGPAEMWDWRLDPGDRYDAAPDPAGSEELLAVTSGTLTLVMSDASYVIPVGGVARAPTDRTYSYVNGTAAPVSFIRVVVINSV